ncbi:hypothetical protein FOPG_06905 [Fusarium oxysporum f. sp. conglutinans race 2 54008]|uniref:Uncharacterized protein n=1 Tax=Fusarium oxysporum f. sp. conglutinans race 2 54008 TaxID=1089457 RepID=X0I4W0_FUSOX|nr:hypothetical protein FOPG_06905 [Fusarium oxysporum f. sp. conglutinans race 2 54008]
MLTRAKRDEAIMKVGPALPCVKDTRAKKDKAIMKAMPASPTFNDTSIVSVVQAAFR